MIENILKWVGGKHTLAPFIIDKMAHHEIYVEVFAGAMNVFLNKPNSTETTSVKSSIINDINGELINFYKVISDEHCKNAMIEYLRAMPYSRDLFKQQLELYRCEAFSHVNHVYRAAVFLYLNATSFNGMFQSFAHRTDHPYDINEINKICKMVFNKFHTGNVTIENMHFKDLIKRYDKDNVLFYLDPPYWVTATPKGNKYYEYVMTKEEHTELRDILAKLVHAKWLMSYDDVPEVRELYKDPYFYKINTPNTFQSCSSRSGESSVTKSELVIANYNIEVEGTLFQKG